MTATGGPPYRGDEWLGDYAERPTGEWPALTQEAQRVLSERQAACDDAVREALVMPLTLRQERLWRFVRYLYERGILSDYPLDGDDHEHPAS